MLFIIAAALVGVIAGIGIAFFLFDFGYKGVPLYRFQVNTEFRTQNEIPAVGEYDEGTLFLYHGVKIG